MSFQYSGRIPASKSILNRALICASYFSGLQIVGDSNCDDVRNLKKAITDFHSGKTELFVGEGGTTFRFLALRVSRQPGRYKLMGSTRLMERPQDELISVLQQLGVEARIQGPSFLIESDGWRSNQIIKVSAKDSSQFLSAVLLNLWDLDLDIQIEKPRAIVSEPYLIMTIKMLKELGLNFTDQDGIWTISKQQKISASKISCEIDLSSAFAVAAIAALDGSAVFEDFPIYSTQADSVFVSILQRMGVKCNIITAREGNSSLLVTQGKLSAISWDLNKAPDLFPVLSALCAFAEGTSHLFGASQLKHKESDRIAVTAKLLQSVGVQCEVFDDGMKIHGEVDLPSRLKQQQGFDFDPDHDHRLAMAAALFKRFNQKLMIQTPEVVNKSFPEFWEISGVSL